jgi:TPR repeat protein
MHPKAWMMAFGLALGLLNQPVIAGPFEDGVAADERGDYGAALKIWQELAGREHAAGLYRLALAYAEGRGVPRDDAKAAFWYNRAAGRGYMQAQSALARAYDDGKGVKRNQMHAMKWYRRAGQQGDVASQVALGLIYDTGRGVPQNDWQAVKWYSLAAQKGNATAQNNLGLLYAQGRGLPQDFEQAYLWLSLAAELGHMSAAESRDEVAESMTQGQIDQARERVRNWLLVQEQEKKARCRVAQLETCE